MLRRLLLPVAALAVTAALLAPVALASKQARRSSVPDGAVAGLCRAAQSGDAEGRAAKLKAPPFAALAARAAAAGKTLAEYCATVPAPTEP